MNEYESVCILTPDLPEARTKKVHDKIKKILNEHQSQIVDQKDWGKRKLAYPIAKHNSGQYIYYNFQAQGTVVTELEKMLKYDEDVMRFITIRLDPKGKALKKVAAIEGEARFKLDENMAFVRPHREGHSYHKPHVSHDVPETGGDHAEKN